MSRTAKLCLLHLLMWHQVNASSVSSVAFKKTSVNLSLLKNIQSRLVPDPGSLIACAVECSLDKTCLGFGYRELPNTKCFLISITTSDETYQSTFEGFDYFVMEDLPSHCGQVQNKESGLALLDIGDGQQFVADCEQKLDGGGWLVFQRRFDGSVDFFRTWDQYKNGFGNVNEEFWLGNDYIHMMTAIQDHMLKIELECDGEVQYADYSEFKLGNESDKYRLFVSGYSGRKPPGDSLEHQPHNHNGEFFSTWDRDNDHWSDQWGVGNCAKDNNYGAWWYSNCHTSDLNGAYGYSQGGRGVVWATWKGYEAFIKTTRMMIKASPKHKP